jgi:hypothetical protein
MNLQKFKNKLLDQGVAFELFERRVSEYSSLKNIIHIINNATVFFEVLSAGFSWGYTPEGHAYWAEVANETGKAHFYLNIEKNIGTTGCQCGGTKCNTGHSSWCPLYKEF